ncbi:hypothetical protein FB45DRAFT_1023053 [Roridomyces roridus]|uniref:Uncharacterized protein n=1 Tax=Roridomyces roridus TaxID=1738132 RepID=A0AAD7FTD1_9AGAR|nr:hypothetical protein FB45DRAFT_1023053 [Roridomyces roridus]
MAGFMYIGWLGCITIPILNAHRRVIAVLGGRPNDPEYDRATTGAHAMMQERLPHLRLTRERLRHRRTRHEFAAVSRGPSYGTGQTEPGELCNNVTNTQITDELLAHEFFKCISGFANSLFAMWAPRLYAYYQMQMEKLCTWKSMRWNFPGCAFAGATFNFGPKTITAPHVDFANLAWGWCFITATRHPFPSWVHRAHSLGARQALKYPNWSERNTELICAPDSAFDNASADVKAQRAAAEEARWEEGVGMFSTLDEL